MHVVENVVEHSEYYQTHNKETSTKIKSIAKKNELIGFEQNDAGEFITILFDLLHKCLKYKIKLSDESLNCFQIPRITNARFTSIGDANSFLYSEYLDDSFHRKVNLSLVDFMGLFKIVKEGN